MLLNLPWTENSLTEAVNPTPGLPSAHSASIKLSKLLLLFGLFCLRSFECLPTPLSHAPPSLGSKWIIGDCDRLAACPTCLPAFQSNACWDMPQCPSDNGQEKDRKEYKWVGRCTDRVMHMLSLRASRNVLFFSKFIKKLLVQTS